MPVRPSDRASCLGRPWQGRSRQILKKDRWRSSLLTGWLAGWLAGWLGHAPVGRASERVRRRRYQRILFGGYKTSSSSSSSSSSSTRIRPPSAPATLRSDPKRGGGRRTCSERTGIEQGNASCRERESCCPGDGLSLNTLEAGKVLRSEIQVYFSRAKKC